MVYAVLLKYLEQYKEYQNDILDDNNSVLGIQYKQRLAMIDMIRTSIGLQKVIDNSGTKKDDEDDKKEEWEVYESILVKMYDLDEQYTLQFPDLKVRQYYISIYHKLMMISYQTQCKFTQ